MCAVYMPWFNKVPSLLRGRLPRIFLWMRRVCAALVAVVAAVLLVSWFAIDWTGEGADEYPGGIVLRDSAGEVLRVSLGPGDVDCRPYYEADPDDWIVKALVASEDGEFWTHCGVRPLSIARALWQNVACRRRISGASTISMQAVRLIKPHRKTYFAKWVEAVQAVKMERRKSKRWILSQYLNRAPYGSNFVGIEAAANGWFGKGAKDLGIGEAAMLAGIVQAPSRFRPDRTSDEVDRNGRGRGYEGAIKRRDYVLSRMLAMGYITEEQMEGAKGVRPVVCRAPRPFLHPYYCDYYLRQVLGRDREAQRRSGDFVTPLDADVQRMCENAVAEAAQDGGFSSAAVVMRVDTGDVIALAVSGDYFGGEGGQVNAALSPRPAGSTLKPFLAALAMECGIAGPETLIPDAPLVVDGYRPANFDGRYRGDVTLADSLVLSLNIPFVRLCRRTGLERFGTRLRELGLLHVDPDFGKYGLGLAIGNAEVTLVELVGAYRSMAASRSAADYLVAEALSGPERSRAALGHVAAANLPRFAWKTGTSSAYRDAWTVAWNPQYVVGVWCGHLSGGFGDERVVGAKAAAPVAWKIARSLYPRGEGPWFVGTDEAERLRARAPARLGGAERLAVASPGNGTVFALVKDVPQQRVVCRAVGELAAGRLWWFLDGAPVGETDGGAPFVLDLPPGGHTIAVSSADGTSAESSVSVE